MYGFVRARNGQRRAVPADLPLEAKPGLFRVDLVGWLDLVSKGLPVISS
jgi:hypothetical protein